MFIHWEHHGCITFISSDFHGAWQNYTGVSAPLYKRFDERDEEKMFNQVRSRIV